MAGASRLPLLPPQAPSPTFVLRDGLWIPDHYALWPLVAGSLLTIATELEAAETPGAWSGTAGVEVNGDHWRVLSADDDAEAYEELAFLPATPWPADKRVLIVAEFGSIQTGSGVTAAAQAKSASLLIDDIRVLAAHQIGYCTRVPLGFAGYWVNWATGAPASGASVRNGSATVLRYLVDFAPHNVGGALVDDPLVQHRAYTLSDGVVATAHGGKTGTVLVDAIRFVAQTDPGGLLDGTPGEVHVRQCAIYVQP